jgi:hypothetical protein
LFEMLGAICPAVRSSPNAAPVCDALKSDALTVLCDGDRLAHVQRLGFDLMLADLFGIHEQPKQLPAPRVFKDASRARDTDHSRINQLPGSRTGSQKLPVAG